MKTKTDKTGKERRDLVFPMSVMPYLSCTSNVLGNNKHVSHRKTKRGNCFSCESQRTHCIVLHADLKSQNSTEMTSPRCWLITELARIRQFRFELSNWFLLYNYHAILYFTISDFLCAPWLSIHSITCSDFMRIELEFSHRIASFLKRYLGIT